MFGLALLGQVAGLSVKPATPGVVTVSASTAPSKPAPNGPGPFDGVLVVLAIGGAAFAVWRPKQGIAERISGVVLVPK